MSPSQVVVGQRFLRLEVKSFLPLKDGHRMALTICDCGKRFIVRVSSLTDNNTRSCGCFSSDSARLRTQTHRMTKTPTYVCHQNMKKRCCDPLNKAYKRYGGRGIKICKSWMSDFRNFLKDMGVKPDGMTIERIDNNLGYSKSNCRWATRKEQSNNLEVTVILKHGGVSGGFSFWSEKTRIPKHTLETRIRRGWTVRRTIETPLQNYTKPKNQQTPKQ